MNQLSSIGFGSDASVFAGYAQAAGDKLGNIDFVFENTGPNAAYLRLMQYDGVTSPSGFAQVGSWMTLAAGGTLTQSYVLLSKRVGFFGSGNTIVNISTIIRNKADLRGAQIDILASGRFGWGYDEGYNKLELKKKWGAVPGPVSTTGNHEAGTGAPIDSSVEGV